MKKRLLNAKARNKLMKVHDAILEEPRRIDMGSWMVRMENVPEQKRPECGTVGCIAGWIVALEFKKPKRLYEVRDWEISRRACAILGIGEKDAQTLFHSGEFPYQFRGVRDLPPGSPRYAKLVAARIKNFVETDGQG